MPSSTPKQVPYPIGSDAAATLDTTVQSLAEWVDASPGVATMTTTERNALPSAGKWLGRVIFNSTDSQMQVYTSGSVWVSLQSLVLTDGSVTLAKLAAEVANRLTPAGVINAYLGASAPAGWLLHNQAVASASTLYPALWAAAPASWKSGSTLNIPDLTDDVLIQTGGAAAALGAEGGSMSVTIGAANMPPHVHDLGSHSHTANTGFESGNHTHSGTTSGQSTNHRHGPGSGNTFVTQSNSGSAAISVVSGPAQPLSDATLTGVEDTVHVHTITTGGVSANHTHAVAVNAAVGNTGSAGSGTALTTRPLHLGVNYIIKAH